MVIDTCVVVAPSAASWVSATSAVTAPLQAR
jgi:hypothetical protein